MTEHDDDARTPGAPDAAADDAPDVGRTQEQGPVTTTEETAVAEEAQSGPEPVAGEVEDDGAGPPAPRRGTAPWWRLAVAAVAVGGLVWGASAADGSWSLGADRATGSGDGGAGDAGSSGSFVEAALLGCPGPEPLTADGASPRAEVLAVGAPESVLDGTPPARVADAEATTAGPDADATTAGPDSAASTAGPDNATSTAGPDGAVSTAGPDGAAATAGPDSAGTTAAPDEGAAPGSGDAEDLVPAGASALRTTDGAAVELLRGEPVGLPLEGSASALVEARDGLAPGVAGGQLAIGTDQGARGLTLAGCAAPAEESWLVGGGDEPGRTEQLVLTNPGPDAVTVEVGVTGADGPVATTGAGAIVVPGHGRVVELLDAIAPGVAAPVVRVTASGGPVVAHLAEGYRDGTTDRGSEIVSAGTAPGTDVVVPALPLTGDDRAHEVVLRVAAPGESEAVVDLTALTADGAVRLPDRVMRVPAGSSVDLTLDELPEGALALRLRSDEPVVAGARLDVLPSEEEPTVVDDGTDRDLDGGAGDDTAEATRSPGTSDDEDGGTTQAEPLRRPAGETAWVSSTVPSTTPLGMAFPGRSVVPDATSELALTAVDGTTAWVTWVDDSGEKSSSSVDLPNDTTVLVPVPQDARAVWVVGAGPAGVVAALHVGGQDATGPYAASATLPQLPWQRQQAEVRTVVP